jgi:hypothetical protein
VIPPAWRYVWNCPLPNGHLQATSSIHPRVFDPYEAGSTIAEVVRHHYANPDRRQAALERAVLGLLGVDRAEAG